MTDRLDLVNAFEAAGIERKAAEHVAAEIFDAIRENVATKTDIAELAHRIELVEHRLEARIDRVVVRLGMLMVTLAGLILAAIRYLPHG
jgi:hypothetical protein